MYSFRDRTWFPELEYDLGEATGPMEAWGASVYARHFEQGLVVVNADDEPANVALPRTYLDVTDAEVMALDLGATRGAILRTPPTPETTTTTAAPTTTTVPPTTTTAAPTTTTTVPPTTTTAAPTTTTTLPPTTTTTEPVVIAREKGKQLSYPYMFERVPGQLWVVTRYNRPQNTPPVCIHLREADFVGR
jgi:hypothetical protein